MVYITPTLDDMVAVAQAGATVVAIDGTQRPRPDQLTLTLEKFRVLCPNTPVMADCDTLLSALAAEAAGLDAIATTLSGYTQESLQDKASLYTPDWALLYQLSQHSRIPIVMEGRLWEPVHVTKAFRLGASAVVIGSAITRPHEVTRRFLTGANGFA
jgi:putative N-acetylmannosamine-6-phosphate epimerase